MRPLPRSLTLRDPSGIVLRDWERRDAPSIEPACGRPDICRFTSVPWQYTPAAASAWIERLRQRRESGSGLALAITLEPEDAPVGNVNLVRFSPDGRDAALGYWVVPAARGRGLATRASQVLCSWGFRELGVERIELAILPENLASHAVARALGATHDGLRAHSHREDGRWWDMVIYSLTAHSLAP